MYQACRFEGLLSENESTHQGPQSIVVELFVMTEMERRRRQRANWPIRKFALGEEPLVDSREDLSAEQRIMLTWRLSAEACNLAGLPKPHYSRATMPGVMVRADD